MATAKNRALDHFRHIKMQTDRHAQIGHDLQTLEALVITDFVNALEASQADDIGDDMLRLIFTACHPVLGAEARVALTLKLLGGLSTAEIARAYLVPEPTIAQRIGRAKRKLTEARVPFELPQGEALAPRLASVLEVLYLIFNEGYTATSGSDWMRPALMQEALRLGRVLAELAPLEAEVHGLMALMELQASRAVARVDAQGKPVLLSDQNRSTWDTLLIRRGLAALERAESTSSTPGAYTLQAAIAACHARASTVQNTDWARIVTLYETLAQINPSPIIELNRAVAVSMAFGPAAALEIVDALMLNPQLNNYHWLPSVRADLLAKLGRHSEASAAFECAAGMTQNRQERELLLTRAQACKTLKEFLAALK